MKKKTARRLSAAFPNAGKPSPALRRPPPVQASPDELPRVLQRLAGEAVIMFSHPDGFLGGMRSRVLELNRAHRWKMLARKLRRELKQERAKR